MMPGVLLTEDDQNYPEDTNTQSSAYFETMFPHVAHSQAQLMRNNSFSGTRDGTSLSHSAPIYHRSQSAISSSALQGFRQFYSPPTTPKKSGNGFSGQGSDVGEDMSSLNGDAGDVVLVGLSGASASSPLSMTSSSHHREFQSDIRSFFDGNASIVGSPTLGGSASIPIHKFLPSNDDDESWGGSVVDVYACDQFRMFEFKVRRCMRGRSHDWTECPFAHPGEKARRRDPRRFHYSGTACPDFRKGSCRRGDACEFAHGVFECWLHPARYRTQPCKDGRNCRRRVCFFAHTPDQLRLLPAAAQAASAAARNGGGFGLTTLPPQLSGSYDGSPGRNGVSYDGAYGFDSSPVGCVSHCPPSPHGNCQNGAVHGGCVHFDGSVGGNANVHNGHCCASPHMSSPTSTLVGHSPSPPPLSPPLSPSGSPPMSPQSPHHWPNSPGAQNLASSSQSSLQAQAQAAACMQVSIQASMTHQHGYTQGQSSPLSRSSSSQQSLSAAHAHQAQSLTPAPPGHRRHLDRLNSMPTLSIPQVEHAHRGMLQNVSSPLSSPSSCSPPSPGVTSQASVNELIATIQSLNLRGGPIPLWLQPQPAQPANQYSSGPSPLRRCSQSVPCTPTKLRWDDRTTRWEGDDNDDVEPPVQRVESGRDLRAKIYGRLGKENRMDAEDAPDLGWVNELVTDDQRANVGW